MNPRPALFVALASALFACSPPRMTTDRSALSLAFAPRTSAIDPRGDILIGSDPIEIERGSPSMGEVLWSAPPVILHTSGNGMGTRNASTTTMLTQQTHLL